MITGSERESRELMITAAIRLIAVNGFEGFRTKTWAREAGVAEGSLYYHFHSKDELLEQAYYFVDRDIAEFCDGIAVSCGEDAGALSESIMELWECYRSYARKYPERVAYYERFRKSARFTEQVRASGKSAVSDALTHILPASRREGERELTAEILQCFFLNMTAEQARRAAEGQDRADDVCQKILQMLIEGGVERLCADYS